MLAFTLVPSVIIVQLSSLVVKDARLQNKSM